VSRHRSATAAGALALVLAPLGCASEPRAPEPAQPFVFRELNLRQQDPQGRPRWELKSPETRYDLTRKLAQSRDLTGMLYEDGKPLYRFSAASGVVLNEGELVQLEGPIRLERLDQERPMVLTGLRLRWYPAQGRMEMDRQPKAVSGDLEFTAGLARFLIDQDRLELRQRPLLRQGGAEPAVVELGSVDWSPGSGQLRAAGPIRGRRRLADGGIQRFSATSLTGNTTSQIVDLQAPVRLEDPTRQAVIDARATRVDIARQIASSDQPFRGRHGETRLSGNSFQLNASDQTVQVEGACRLQQPGEELQARRCRWNWENGEAQASGAVVLRREANGLETTAEQLEGRIDANGFAQFSNPGGRVRTEVRLPAGPGDGDGRPLRPDRDQDRRAAPAFQL
jgi:LPS export ABC transporter protein LptC